MQFGRLRFVLILALPVSGQFIAVFFPKLFSAKETAA